MNKEKQIIEKVAEKCPWVDLESLEYTIKLCNESHSGMIKEINKGVQAMQSNYERVCVENRVHKKEIEHLQHRNAGLVSKYNEIKKSVKFIHGRTAGKGRGTIGKARAILHENKVSNELRRKVFLLNQQRQDFEQSEKQMNERIDEFIGNLEANRKTQYDVSIAWVIKELKSLKGEVKK
ncbi:MAG: hypothetical protein JSW41_03975 [Candidatus Aenigmatarchaeota archaeon]|nr:MAG: hypothetical protein JSW41_03975 [Candidatus Aenigmarchaeota archaeon]